MFKIFGILLLAACPAAAGFLLAGAKSKRIAQLQAALVLLGALEQYISYETATLSEITYKLKEDARFHVLGLSMLDTHRRDAAAALCACFRENPALCLEQQDVQLLCDCCSNLGATDTDGQIRHCRMYRQALEQRLEEQRSVCRQKSRLYRSLGVFAGLFCAVLFC